MAVHAGRLPFTDLDAVCCFAVEVAMALQGEHTYYCRYVFGSGPAARAALVCCTRVASYDSLGRLVQVSAPNDPVSVRTCLTAFVTVIPGPFVVAASSSIHTCSISPQSKLFLAFLISASFII